MQMLSRNYKTQKATSRILCLLTYKEPIRFMPYKLEKCWARQLFRKKKKNEIPKRMCFMFGAPPRTNRATFFIFLSFEGHVCR